MKNVEFLTGTQISTRDGSEIDSDLTYKFEKLDRFSQGVFVSKNQTKVTYPLQPRAREPASTPRYISARRVANSQDCQPHPFVPSLAASTFTFGALLWRYRKFKFKIFKLGHYNICIYPYITNFISPQQHGFLKKRSTVTNLACFSQYVSESINQGSQVDTIYTDFSKAFDRVDHRLIISKLDMFGISNKVLHLLQSYLFNRQQFVSYNGFSSFLYHSTSGIPQGSNLGPLLFICFINDLPSALTCGSLLYADDNKMYSTINNLAGKLE
jgi:hypothetical protein